MLTDLSPFAVGGPLYAMTHYKQFLLFQRTVWDEEKKKWGKKPIQANGWGMPWRSKPYLLMTYQEAATALASRDDCALGFVLCETDPFFCVDGDHHFANGQWTQKALDCIAHFPGSVVEKSMSGDGFHIFGSTVDIPHACENMELGAEFYTKHRAMALTGDFITPPGDISNDFTLEVMQFVDQYFKREERTPKKDGERATLDDLEKIKECLKFIDADVKYGVWLAIVMAIHAVGVEADAEETAFQIAEDWSAEGSKYIAGYLEHKWGGFDSDGGSHIGTIYHYAKEGGYKTREEIDVAKAFAQYQEALPPVIPPPPPPLNAEAPPPPPVNEVVEVTVEQHVQGIRYPTDYLPMFGACAYISGRHCIWTPDGQVMDQKRFDHMFMGHQYALDQEARKLTDSPWEAFFKCRVYKFRRVGNSCFRPDLPPGTIIQHEGRFHINTFYPIKVARRKGDVTPFLNHLEKVLPNERDRRILLSYMAALVQNPGKKFQWAPLIQGEEGNGKTFFTHCLENAVGSNYTHYPQANDLDNKFNAWMVDKLLIAIEDLHVPGHRSDIIEALKPMITGTRAPIQGKGVDQVTMTVCANFIFNSNHRGALGSAVKGRRYCVFYTAQQKPEHIARDGMDGSYFPELYGWALRGGYAFVTDYLHNYEIAEEFNPAGNCVRAPQTSTYDEVITEALGVVEQEVLAAVMADRPGFVAPWISSHALDRLLRESHLESRVPRNKRRALVESLGYVRHPHLVDGRTNNAVMPDASRTTLFVKKGHPVLELNTAAAIAERYQKTQQEATAGVNPAAVFENK
jgi:hypothetical protein